LTGNIIKNKDTLKLFGIVSYIGVTLLAILALCEVFVKTGWLKDVTISVMPVDVLAVFSVLYIVAFLFNKVKGK
jgi:hypothetical protein